MPIPIFLSLSNEGASWVCSNLKILKTCIIVVSYEKKDEKKRALLYHEVIISLKNCKELAQWGVRDIATI